MTEIIKAIAVLIGFFIGAILVIFVGIGAGYLFGMLIAVTPFVSDWLTQGLPISKTQIPGIVAWLTVLGAFIKTSSTIKVGGDDE